VTRKKDPLPLTDALGLVGGTVPNARLNEVSLLTKVDGKYQPTKVNLAEWLKNGTVRDDPVVRAGDIIYVPDPKQPRSFNPLSLLQYAVLLGQL